MVYDGDCRFCTLWIKRWQQTTGDQIDYLPLQDARVAEKFPEIARARFESAVHLIEPDGQAYSGAEAALRALARNRSHQWGLWLYRRSAFLATTAERGYRLIAQHRSFLSTLTRLAYGNHVERPSQRLVCSIFLRALGIIYLFAFTSLWTQIAGLIGSNGILPAPEFMEGVRLQADQQRIGLDRYRLLPTLCWWSASDASLQLQCALGSLLAVLVIIGIAPAPCLFLLWVIYLSLATVARVFLGFQWDNLLLETGFLAIFLAPWQLLPRRSHGIPPSRLVLWLLRLLLFKLMFQAGCVKLLSGDAAWRDLTALTLHYETQPLPTWIGWYAHQLPSWIHKLSCLAMFGLELAVPFLFFAPRRPRMLAAALTALLQVLILLTGNYTFFNWLALALCLTLLDDLHLQRMTPRSIRRWFTSRASPLENQRVFRWRRAIAIPLAIVVVTLTLLQLLVMFGFPPRALYPVAALNQWLSPLRSFNASGLFAVITTRRLEIVLEGSRDGIHWQPYEFKHKAGDVKRRPRFVAPHQPRLDWQMWFAALGHWRQHPWILNLCTCLQRGSPEVLALLEKNPFPEQPPRFVRATLYDYRFTDFAERRRTGDWWVRKPVGEYLPPIASRRNSD